RSTSSYATVLPHFYCRFFFSILPLPPCSTLFPYTTLFRSPPTVRSRTRDTVIGRFPPHAPERAIRRTVPPEPARFAADLAPPGRGDYPAWAKPYSCHSPRSARGRRRGGRTPFCASPLPHLQVTC